MRSAARRVERPLTAAALERSAQWHLGRRALTAGELRERLMRKVRRAEAVHGPCAEAAGWVDALITRCVDSLLVNDRAVAAGHADSDARHGRSSRSMRERLRRRRLSEDVIAGVVDGGPEADLAAALVYIRRRRLGARRPDKALAALARQGFSFDVAKRVLVAAGSPSSNTRDGLLSPTK